MPPIKEFYAEQNQLLPAYVEKDLVDVIKRVTELMEAFGRLPEKIEDADVAGRYTQLQKGRSSRPASRMQKPSAVDLNEGPLAATRIA